MPSARHIGDRREYKSKTDTLAQSFRVEELGRRMVWGQTLSEAAFEMGIALKSARYTSRTPEFKTLVERLRGEKFAELDARDRTRMADVQAKAQKHAPDAMDQLVKLMKAAASEGVQRACANDIIEYAGVVRAAEKPPILQLQAGQMAVLVQTIREDKERSPGGGRA